MKKLALVFALAALPGCASSLKPTAPSQADSLPLIVEAIGDKYIADRGWCPSNLPAPEPGQIVIQYVATGNGGCMPVYQTTGLEDRV